MYIYIYTYINVNHLVAGAAREDSDAVVEKDCCQEAESGRQHNGLSFHLWEAGSLWRWD